MTRESKIALLVGLGFIICFGVIISGSRDDQKFKVSGAVAVPIDPGAGGAILAPALMARSGVLARPSQTIYRIANNEPVAPVRPVPQPAAPAMRSYTVKRGDSLSKIAAEVYGRGGRDQYMRIFEANRDVMSSPSRVIPGRTLRIPALAGMPTVAQRESAPVTAGSTYTVQQGDTLTAIARKTMGTSSQTAVRALHELNLRVAPDANRLQVGTVLRIPR